MEISTELADVRLAATVAWLASGRNAVADVYDGERPEFGAAPAGRLLVTIRFAAPFGTIADGELNITPTEESLIMTSGRATWARLRNGAGRHAWDCAVSDLAGTAPLKMPTTQLYAGGYARIVAGRLR